jgi:hypothetical protein
MNQGDVMRVAISFLVLVGVLSCTSRASARLIENWPYERLFKEADLIVIATALHWEKTDDRWPRADNPLERYVGGDRNDH